VFDGHLQNLFELARYTDDEVISAVKVERLTLSARTVANVLASWSHERNTEAVKTWALFMSSGFIPRASAGERRGADIEYEKNREEAIVDALFRMRELGDAVDGDISPEDLEELIAALTN